MACGVGCALAGCSIMPPLHKACDVGDTGAVARLTRSNADIDQPWSGFWYFDYQRATPLMIAARRGHADIVTMLLNAGARSRGDAAEYAVLANEHQCLTPLLDGMNRSEAWKKLDRALVAAALRTRGELVAQLLQAGANPNARDGRGFTPLMTVPQSSARPAILQQLVAAGADVAAKNNEGQQALHIWASQCDRDTVEWALQCGADPDAEDALGRTPRANWGLRCGHEPPWLREQVTVPRSAP